MAKLDSRKQKLPSQHERHIRSISQALNHPSLDSNFIQRAQANPLALHPTDIMMLQRTVGNQAVLRLLDAKGKAPANGAGQSAPAVQRKLKVGAANDSYEQEADQVARQMVGAPHSIPSGERAQPQALVQRQAQGSFAAGGDFESRLNQTKGSGQALPGRTRAEFEPKFGVDLSGVRIHTNSDSNALNRQIQAKAFTHGNDIHFSQGAYNPHSSEGKQILAHELAHTIQQSGGTQLHHADSGIQRSPNLTPAPHATIQRLTITAAALAGTESMSDKMWGLFSADKVFDFLKHKLNVYEQAKSLAIKRKALQSLLSFANFWLTENSGDVKKRTPKANIVRDLLGEVMVELPQIDAKFQDAKIKKVAAIDPKTKVPRNPKHKRPQMPLPKPKQGDPDEFRHDIDKDYDVPVVGGQAGVKQDVANLGPVKPPNIQPPVIQPPVVQLPGDKQADVNQGVGKDDSDKEAEKPTFTVDMAKAAVQPRIKQLIELLGFEMVYADPREGAMPDVTKEVDKERWEGDARYRNDWLELRDYLGIALLYPDGQPAEGLDLYGADNYGQGGEELGDDQQGFDQQDDDGVTKKIVVDRELYEWNIERITKLNETLGFEIQAGDDLTYEVKVDRNQYIVDKHFAAALHELNHILGNVLYLQYSDGGLVWEEEDRTLFTGKINQGRVDPAHKAYANKVKNHQLKYLSQQGKAHAVDTIKGAYKYEHNQNIIRNDNEQRIAGQKLAIKQLARDYKLTKAEAMAIGIYTSPDYKYINPTLSKNHTRMDKGLKEIAKANAFRPETNEELKDDPTPTHFAEAANEAHEHSKFAMSGLMKLPVHPTRRVYRGLALQPAELQEQYLKIGIYVADSFTSTDQSMTMAMKFAKDGVDKPENAGSVPVLLRMIVSNGKDISALSRFHGTEAEILVLPGAEFEVQNYTVEDDCHIIDLKQIK